MTNEDSVIIGVVSIPEGERLKSLLQQRDIQIEIFPQNMAKGG